MNAANAIVPKQFNQICGRRFRQEYGKIAPIHVPAVVEHLAERQPNAHAIS
jgi:hypothetical protein